jgi:hypothetical protein
MKNFILTLLLFLPYISNSQTIQEFYDLFEHSERKSTHNTETNQVSINEKNAFIKIQNPQEPDDVIRFKSFTKKDKTKIFGFQYSASQPDLGLVMSRTEFYVFKDKQWIEITEQVCPSLKFADYWGTQPLPHHLLQEFNLDLTLPQTGTTIVAKSNPAMAVQFPYSNLPHDYSETFEKRKFKTIELNWNKTKGTFEIGKKY